MKPEDFCYWLKGFFELSDSKNLSQNQVLMIKEHLNLVFNKVTAPLQFDVEAFEKSIKDAKEKGKRDAGKFWNETSFPEKLC